MFEEKRDNWEELTAPTEPEEVVSWYTPRSKEGQEVVSYYVQARELPEKARRAEPAPPKKRSRRGLWIFLACLGVIAAAVIAAAVLGGEKEPIDDVELPDDGDASSIVFVFEEMETYIPVTAGDPDVRLQVQTSHGAELTAQQLYASVNPSVVTVVANEDDSSSVGTGVIMTSDGYILTNAHVISGAESCWIALDIGVTYDVELVGYDVRQDLAVLKAVDAHDLPAATFGDSDLAVVGDTVYAIGNPLGLELRGTLTNGIISAVNRDVVLGGNSMTLLQTNAALNNGNSGGPLINIYGQVIGINVMKMTGTGARDEATVEGLGFALPISDMAFVVNDIMTYGYYRGTPMLGITVRTIMLEDGQTAVVVEEVTAGFSAQDQGVQSGDIILAADGQPVSITTDLLAVRRNHVVGDTMILTVQRGEEVFDVEIVLRSDRG